VPSVFPGGKDGLCVRLTSLPPSCTVTMKSGNLNFLEPSGPLQASNGAALPFCYIVFKTFGTACSVAPHHISEGLNFRKLDLCLTVHHQCR